MEGWKRVDLSTETTNRMATRKTYSREFKEEAVRLAKQNGNQSQTARDLRLQLSVLRRWKKELEQGGGHRQDEEFPQLQKENQRLKETVEILKKAVGIFTNRS